MHFFDNDTKSDTRELFDREVYVFVIIQREHASAKCFDRRASKTFFQRRRRRVGELGRRPVNQGNGQREVE
jgi:hypothetical protein